MAGDRDKARKYAAELIAVAENADSDRPELQRARLLTADAAR
jgi:hypothetical protein